MFPRPPLYTMNSIQQCHAGVLAKAMFPEDLATVNNYREGTLLPSASLSPTKATRQCHRTLQQGGAAKVGHNLHIRPRGMNSHSPLPTCGPWAPGFIYLRLGFCIHKMEFSMVSAICKVFNLWAMIFIGHRVRKT